VTSTDDQLDYFQYDKEFEQKEQEYDLIKNEILGKEHEETEQPIKVEHVVQPTLEQGDKQILDSVNLKKQIYLTIMSSVNFEETVHKLVRAGLTESHEMEVCTMIIECCCQERTYLRYYGLMAQRFCFLDKVFQAKFDECFKSQYEMIHRLDTNKLRNVAKFFAHLMNTDALSWSVMHYIELTQETTSSSSRIFCKILFQELCENMGLKRLNERLHDEYLQEYYKGIFPKDSAKNMRFAINFFTSIGLGGLTEDLRESFKNAPKQQESSSDDSSDDSSSDSSSDSE
jgi:pre-mRNA-splicing factor CWC22